MVRKQLFDRMKELAAWCGAGVEQVFDVTVDDSGYVYIVGEVSSVFEINTGQKVATVNEGGGLIAKFDPNGNLVFAKARRSVICKTILL